MTIIQETEDLLIYRDFCVFTWHEERFIKNKHTCEESMFAEDVAKILGFRDVHEMITDPEVQNLIDLSTLEPGVYPITTMTIDETKKLFEGIADTPSEKLEFFGEHYGHLLPSTAESECKDGIDMIIEGNPTIVEIDILHCDVKTTSSDGTKYSKEFALKIFPHPEDGWITLTIDDLEHMISVLNDFKPAE